MDVTALSVSIDVDISAFIDAMEQMTAMLLALADEFEQIGEVFEQVAADIKDAFSGINKSGGENETLWDRLWDKFKKFIETATIVKEAIELLVWLFKGLSSAMVAITESGFAEEFGAIVLAIAQAIPVVDVVVDIIAVLAIGIAGIIHLCSGASDSIQGVSKDTAELSGNMKLSAAQITEVQERLKGMSSVTGFKFDSSDDFLNGYYNNKNSNANGFNVSDKGVDLNKINKVLAANRSNHEPLTSASTSSRNMDEANGQQSSTSLDFQSAPTEADNANQKSLFDDFIKRYQDYYERLKQLNPPSNAVITAKASSIAESASGPEASNQTLQSNSGNSIQQIIPEVKQATVAVAEYNEKIKEAAELNKEAQSAAVSAFSTIGQAIGQMMAGQKNINPLAALMKQMGDSLKKYGEFLITAGTAMLFGGDPFGAAKVGEGIALEAVGTAMGSIKMAQGGIVSGSTFANIGEYAGASHNPEVVAPLDKLKNMLGGTNNSHQFSFQIAGDNLLSMQDRIQNNNQFVMTPITNNN